MKNWEKYLLKQRKEYLSPPLPVDFAADLIVVIPCCNEKQVFVTLDNLRNCNSSCSNVIVLIVINSSIKSEDTVVVQNRRTYAQIQTFSQKFTTDKMLFFPVIFEKLPRKHAGVGLARKIGMDLGIDYYLNTHNSRGILVSLDADCTISENYLMRIYETFAKDKKICCTIHNFHHRVESDNPEIENAVRQYEAYIRYLELALKFIGFPYYYHTIGSAFAVSANAYVAVGGMGRQQGGEDFYFLQKIFVQRDVAVLNDVFVYPLARFSDRVPFGTGPALRKIIDNPDHELKVYNMDAFIILKDFFDLADQFFLQDEATIRERLKEIAPILQTFIIENKLVEGIIDCNNNCATQESFKKRFFCKFNAFRIIKFLNYSHLSYFHSESVDLSLSKIKKYIGN